MTTFATVLLVVLGVGAFLNALLNLLWMHYDNKKPCHMCRYHGAVSRHAPCDTCGIKHEYWEENK